ncbi:MAG: Uma2 family endonuclease [Clostridiales bacterium]|nr:Uma2 family endonuclease [Clostridiales bacterium]
MPLPEERIYTIEDIYNLPDGQRAELLDGQIYDMAPPGRTHQRLVGALYRKIADYIDLNGGSCEVDIAPFAVFLNQDELNYVEPDISVICDPKKLTDKGCSGAPDWIIEIVSPASRRMDYMVKLFKYRSAEVREYWIADPDKGKITVYDFAGDEPGYYTFSDKIPVGIYPGFSIDFSTIVL